MKLLFVSRSTPFHRLGGMEMVAWDLARALRRRGHEVEFLTTRLLSLPAGGEIDGIRIHALDVPSGRYSRAWWRQSAARFVRDHAARTDLVLGIGGGAHAIVDAARRHGISMPIVLQSHGTPWGEIISKLAVRTARSWAGAARNIPFLLRDSRLAHYAHIVTIGPAVAAALRASPMRRLVGATPISVIENGVNVDQFRFSASSRQTVRESLGIPAIAPVVLSMSRMIFQKGVKEALLGFAEASREMPDAVYLIAGSGSAEPALRAIVVEHGLQERVHFLGTVKREQIPAVLSAADLFLFTSLRQEGLAIAPLEAAASGMAAVLSRHILAPELHAAAVDPSDTAAVAAAIRANLSVADKSRPSLLPVRYSLDHAADQYETLFEQLAGSVTQRDRDAN